MNFQLCTMHKELFTTLLIDIEFTLGLTALFEKHLPIIRCVVMERRQNHYMVQNLTVYGDITNDKFTF